MTSKVVVVRKMYHVGDKPKPEELKLAQFLYGNWTDLKFLHNFVASTDSKDIEQKEHGVFVFKDATKNRQFLFAATQGDHREANVTVRIEKQYPNTIVFGDEGLGILQSLKKILSHYDGGDVLIEIEDYVVN